MQNPDQINNVFFQRKLGDYNINYRHHIIFWLAYMSFNILRWGSLHHDFLYSLKTNLLGFPIHMALAYFNIYFLMPKFVYRRKYFTYTILILSSLFIMLLVKFNLTYYLIDTNVMPEAGEVQNLTLDYAIATMLGELYVVSFVTAIKTTIDWLQEKNKLHELEKRQLTTELKFLRSQVSPHFFFNTLNNIYSLTLEKSDKAPQIVLKLSELMRYLIYNSDAPHQDLTKEIEFIRNYIELERIRFDESLKIDLQFSGDMKGKTIPPMLLIPLVENCFKHGANKTIGPKEIFIKINVIDDNLNVQVVNNIPNQTEQSPSVETQGGIGLLNVKKRLELGFKKNDYNLSIYKKENMFNVNLKLKV
ncbi:Histidine kinase [Arenibacter nanhaiticus]|uniref:Histidine kinase n=2 Tax=Arenibacter nanhaiticus TaxID=558155 RepID=A0A1M6M1Q1_9FLAO|nr:Histidine kinase [Arenibacter nanhaiticus]